MAWASRRISSSACSTCSCSRSRPSRAPKGGSASGLTIVRSLVELHGGSVRAHSPGLGHGSEFTVELPAAPGEAAIEQAPASRAAPAQAGRRVLVVDDNVDAAQAVAALMGILGHTVRVAHDGK